MSESNKPRLGVFIGVFTPTVLTILGVIMYLRLGWVVANAGLGGALAIIFIANAITLMTTLSMSALATNMRVGVGGAYFLISRSFGLEMGGAVGIPLYLSQVLSVTLYAYGLAESVRIVWPGMPDGLIPVLAAIIVVAVSAIASKSIEVALKLQLPIMIFIFGSILALVMGVEFNGLQVDLFVTDGEYSFWEVFAVFFPAVTGILAGVSLSGDLEDPGQAIPVGALASVFVGAVVYMSLPVVLAHAGEPELLADPLAWTKIAWWPLVVGGLWGAILSSAFGSILGAPRTLQALAEDRLAPRFLAQIDEKTGEPMVGLYVSGGLALLACLLGQLNAVASVVTMFFLTTYGALNLVTFLETVTGDPAYRPRIRVPWWVSLAGGVGCFATMFLIDWKACLVALAIEGVLFYGLSRRTFESTWGDVRGGLWMTTARYALMNLRSVRLDSRNWRPHILVFTRDLEGSVRTVRMADLIGQHRGIVTACTLLEGDVEEHDQASRILERDNRILLQQDIVAFCEVTCVRDIDEGVVTVAQSNGLAGLHSNTAMFGFADEDGVPLMVRYLKLTRKLGKLEMCTIIFRAGHAAPPNPKQPRITVWWKGRENNGDLMLLLAHLIKQTAEFRNARLVLQTVVDDEDEARARRVEMSSMLPDLRMDLDIRVTVREDEPVHEVIRRESQGASLVFLGIHVAPPGEEEVFAKGVVQMLRGLPPTLMVRNDGPFRGRLV